ncbi:hypothetical protein BDW42DRAFT_165591 [Aspergillus taichungensis]|uniref:Uncharacterized protein n=1 Tax=Aspergillus taichungensis TaxID=482145 RepID=A0A2J5HZS9_9EURO|nr:hypothetical protein BDW42DRAFT_165591 [Aspergillus taichungensis]
MHQQALPTIEEQLETNPAPLPTIEYGRIEDRWRWYIYLDVPQTDLGTTDPLQYFLNRIKSRNYHVYPTREAVARQPEGYFFVVWADENTADSIHSAATLMAKRVAVNLKFECDVGLPVQLYYS